MSIDKITAKGKNASKLAKHGRGGDTMMAHVTPGEVVIPKNVQSPEVMNAIRSGFARAGVPMLRYTVGGVKSSANPKTSKPEYFSLGKVISGGLTGFLSGGGPVGAAMGALGGALSSDGSSGGGSGGGGSYARPLGVAELMKQNVQGNPVKRAPSVSVDPLSVPDVSSALTTTTNLNPPLSQTPIGGSWLGEERFNSVTGLPEYYSDGTGYDLSSEYFNDSSAPIQPMSASNSVNPQTGMKEFMLMRPMAPSPAPVAQSPLYPLYDPPSSHNPSKPAPQLGSPPTLNPASPSPRSPNPEVNQVLDTVRPVNATTPAPKPETAASSTPFSVKGHVTGSPATLGPNKHLENEYWLGSDGKTYSAAQLQAAGGMRRQTGPGGISWIGKIDPSKLVGDGGSQPAATTQPTTAVTPPANNPPVNAVSGQYGGPQRPPANIPGNELPSWAQDLMDRIAALQNQYSNPPSGTPASPTPANPPATVPESPGITKVSSLTPMRSRRFRSSQYQGGYARNF